MSKFDLKVWNKHILIECNNSLLVIDTGSPYSFQKDGIIKIGEHDFNVPKDLMGLDSKYLTEKVGINISGLIGMDIMNRFTVWFDSPRFGNMIIFEERYKDSGGPLSEGLNFRGCPIVNLTVNNNAGAFLFDSGAPVSYVSSRFTQNALPCGKIYDFSPLLQLDKYEADLYYFVSRFEQHEFNNMYAGMPPELEMILASYRIDGIIGFDLIDHFRLIVAHGNLYLAPQGI